VPLDSFSIIESTLREGEQFVGASFSTEQKVEIAQLLDAFGVECIELTSPCASPKSLEDIGTIAKLGLKTKLLTHVRCHIDDAKMAIDTGVDGIDVVIGTSSMLPRVNSGKVPLPEEGRADRPLIGKAKELAIHRLGCGGAACAILFPRFRVRQFDGRTLRAVRS